MPVNSHIKPLGWKEDIHNQATSNKIVCFLLFKVFFLKKKKKKNNSFASRKMFE